MLRRIAFTTKNTIRQSTTLQCRAYCYRHYNASANRSLVSAKHQIALLIATAKRTTLLSSCNANSYSIARTYGVPVRYSSTSPAVQAPSININDSHTMKAIEGDALGMTIYITDQAIKRIQQILSQETSEAALRVAVDSGGCHGYQYRLELTNTIDKSEDIVFEYNNARVVVDSVSLPLLSGAQVDYTTELIGSAFRVASNPNASSTCGCDVSFEIK